jgi:hypothetical protein
MPENQSKAGRNGRWWKDYAIRGMTMEAIAERDGVAKSTVSEAIKLARDSIPDQERAEIRAEIRELYRHVRAEALEIAEMLPAPVVKGQNGDPLYDPEKTGPDGKPLLVRDYSGRLNAYKTAMDAADRERKMFGVDEAARVIVDTGEDESARRLAAESKAYLEQGEKES